MFNCQRSFGIKGAIVLEGKANTVYSFVWYSRFSAGWNVWRIFIDNKATWIKSEDENKGKRISSFLEQEEFKLPSTDNAKTKCNGYELPLLIISCLYFSIKLPFYEILCFTVLNLYSNVKALLHEI